MAELGLRRLTRNQVCPCGYRGFESLSLRHFFFFLDSLNIVCYSHSPIVRSSDQCGINPARSGRKQRSCCPGVLGRRTITWSDGRVAEGTRLESVRTQKVPRVRIPLAPPLSRAVQEPPLQNCIAFLFRFDTTR